MDNKLKVVYKLWSLASVKGRSKLVAGKLPVSVQFGPLKCCRSHQGRFFLGLRVLNPFFMHWPSSAQSGELRSKHMLMTITALKSLGQHMLGQYHPRHIHWIRHNWLKVNSGCKVHPPTLKRPPGRTRKQRIRRMFLNLFQ